MLAPHGAAIPCFPEPDHSSTTHVISPSLIAPARESTPAFEFKMLVHEPIALAIQQRLQSLLEPDPHLDPALGMAYRVASVYFDTPGLDIFHRRRGFRRHKHRVRRYGDEPMVHFERKSKKQNQVWKFRTAVPLARATSPFQGWTDCAAEAPDWFREELAASAFEPICQVSYERSAWVGLSETGPIRLTIDRRVLGSPIAGPSWGRDAVAANLLEDEAIVELKFLSAMPTIFKEVLEQFRLEPKRVSKYRRCVKRLGLDPPGEGARHASA